MTTTHRTKFLIGALRKSLSDAQSVTPASVEEAHWLIDSGLGGLPHYANDLLTHYRELNRLLWSTQSAELSAVLRSFSSGGIESVVMRGADIASRWYEDRPISPRGDLDLLVTSAQRAEVKQLLSVHGFVQGTLDLNSGELVPFTFAEVQAFESQNYSMRSFGKVTSLGLRSEPKLFKNDLQWLKPVFRSGEQLSCVVTIDIAFGLDSSITTESVYAETVIGPREHARVLSVTELLWYLPSLLYLDVMWHGQRAKLGRYAEIARVIQKEAENIDWAAVAGRSIENGVASSVFYVLGFIGKGLGVQIPSFFFDVLHGSNWDKSRDHGWLIHRLFGEIDMFPKEFSE